MGSAYLTFFILARIMGQFGVDQLWFALIIGLFLTLTFFNAENKRAVVAQFMGCVLGLTWGGWHAAPFASGGEAGVRVTKSDALVNGQQILMVQTQHGVVSVRGDGRPGDQGYLICRKGMSLLTPPCQFRHETAVEGQKDLFTQRIDPYPKHWRGWLKALIRGDKSELPYRWRQAFRESGIYHLLVISGFHLGMVVVAGRSLVSGALRSLYILRVITPRTWVRVYHGAGLFVVQSLVLFSLWTGAAPSAQRATLIHSLLIIQPLFFRSLARLNLFKVAGILQSVLFPLNMLTLSSVLTWSAYLIVIGSWHQTEKRNWLGKLRIALFMQASLLCLNGAFFGEIYFASFLANITLVTIFPLVFMAALLMLVVPPLGAIAEVLMIFQSYFIEMVIRIAHWGRMAWGGNLVRGFGDEAWFRFSMTMILAILVLEVLRSCRNDCPIGHEQS